MEGYLLLGVFGLFFIMLAIITTKLFNINDADEFIVAGRKLPFGLIAASVMVSWIWTTSLLGSAEAGMWYGIGGGMAFAVGSFVPFFFFLPIVLRIRKLMPNGVTFTSFISGRYGKKLQLVFLFFVILLALYVSTEQLIGIGYAISLPFDIPYTAVVIISAVIITLYISIAGLRGSVFNDLIQFFVISLVAFVFLPLILKNYGFEQLYNGLVDVATNKNNPNYNPDSLNLFAPAALRYLVVAMVVSMGFVLLGQGYYSKAIAAISRKTLIYSFLVGTILAWAPIPILFGTVLGGTGLAMDLVPGEDIRVTTDVAPYVFSEFFSSTGSLIFSLMVFMAGITTAGNSIVGLQGILIEDIHPKIYKGSHASDTQKVRFARIVTLIFGVIIMIFAIVLEGVSLLYIDILSGILFAAPLGAFILGLFWRRPNQTIAIWSIVLGVTGGVLTFLLIDDPDIDYFYGNVVSLVLPFIIVIIGSLFSKEAYHFDQLKHYRPN
ncbi:sodium:solute symporter family transporter [Lentibacillus saliphilus]|uniref:sodium:solute symporter family transporter n=1 Tax=Lentibacillus saliphilus TaxID=2737028 RepID=UPI001C2FF046|nr:Na(+)/glucose symporter [Lentibacillus saliphilus]